MKLGLLAQPFNTGLGNIAWGFAEHFDTKSLCVMCKPFTPFPERFPVRREVKDITEEDIDWLLDGIDALLIIETPYNWEILKRAHEKGVKVVFMPMAEWLDRSRPELKYVDLFICPSLETYDIIQGNKVLVPSEVPVDLRKFRPRKVKKLQTLLHNSGHGGQNNRNSTPELIQAMELVKSDVHLILNSQFPQVVNSQKITYRLMNAKNYWDLYNGEDVYILPGKYGMAYLGIQEAAASGMPIMFTDMYPFNEYLPKELLIPPLRMEKTTLIGKQQEQLAIHDPKLIAETIDTVCKLSLTKYSEASLKLARDWSWDVWQEKYLQFFQ